MLKYRKYLESLVIKRYSFSSRKELDISGCKNDNGIKDKEKVKLFIKNAKGIE